MAIARNESCPCGSGKKYKRCCGAPGAVPKFGPEVEAVGAPSEGTDMGRLAVAIALVAAAVGAGVGLAMESTSNGVAVGMAVLLAGVIYLMARKPPSSTGRGGNTAIDFGLNQRGQRRNAGPQNRRQRRRK